MAYMVFPIAAAGVEVFMRKQEQKCVLEIGITELEINWISWRVVYLKPAEDKRNYRRNLIKVLTMTDM